MQGRSEDIQPVNTVVESPLNIEIPPTDLASYVFSAGTAKSRGTPVYFNAEFPSQNFSLAQAETCVKRIAKGLQDLGLKRGDRVLLYSGNKLFFPIVFWAVPAAGCIFTGSSPSASATGPYYPTPLKSVD
jgi:4-coumarate--CoA ligase